jgi:hypothetical protein
MGPPVVLTAMDRRLASLPSVLTYLWRQTVRPRQVHMHLSVEPHLLDRGIAPDDPRLQPLHQIGPPGWLQLHWVANDGAYRKIVPFLQAGGYGQNKQSDQYEDDLFITVDDDTLYPPRFVEYLLRHHGHYGCIVAHRGRRIALRPTSQRGKTTASPFQPYNSWHDGLHAPRLANLPTGQGGVLYRRSWFPADLQLKPALALAPTHDDLWLRWLTARQGIPAVILQPNAVALTHRLAFPAASRRLRHGRHSLWHAMNRRPGGNDQALQAVQAHWQAQGFDLAALIADEQEQWGDFY